MNPKICGVITVKSIKEAYSEIITPQTTKCDIVELRLDYLETININEISQLIESTNIPLILTLRSINEGGKFKGTEEQRLKKLNNLIQLKPEFIDIEINTKVNDLNNLMQEASNRGVKTVLSTHYFDKTPPYNELTKILDYFRENKPDIIKIITFARDITDNHTILDLYQAGNDQGVDIVAFCMGDLGLPSRILCVYYGAAFTYASLNEHSAPGQVSAQVMRNIYEGLHKRCAIWK